MHSTGVQEYVDYESGGLLQFFKVVPVVWLTICAGVEETAFLTVPCLGKRDSGVFV